MRQPLYVNLDRVLSHYKIKHKLKNDTVYVERSITYDNDLIMNYTSKAIDTVWLRSHCN